MACSHDTTAAGRWVGGFLILASFLGWPAIGPSAGYSTRAADPDRPVGIANARVFEHPDANALVIKHGRIVAIGDKAQLAAQADSDGTWLDARGGWVLPGLHDAHIHMLSGGFSLVRLEVSHHKSLDTALQAIQQYAATHREQRWITGRGWQYVWKPAGQFPTRHELDAIEPQRPIALVSFDGHSLWANSEALKLAGIDRSTRDPAGGKIEREADGATPTGILLEGAMDLVFAAQPRPTPDESLAALKRAVQHCSRLGLTAVTDLADDPAVVAMYAQLLANDELPLRVSVSLPLRGDLDAYARLRQKYRSPFLRLGFLKGFVDGVIESKTAYLLEPYSGSTERGQPLLGRKRLTELIEEAQARDFVVGVHAIGDGAVRLALNAYQDADAGRERGDTDHDERANQRPATIAGRIEHIEVLDPRDARRFERLNVVASMQPLHANPDGPNPDDQPWARHLGAARLPNSFPWRMLVDKRATLAFGSDWPVMSADPLWGIAVALTRRDQQGQPPEGWNAQQCLTPDEAIRAYSAGSAAADGVGDERGRLAPGMLADLVVLAPEVDWQNPRTLWEGSRIHAVVVDGRVRYRAPR